MSERDAATVPTLAFVPQANEPLPVDIHRFEPQRPIAQLGRHRHQFFEMIYIEGGTGTHGFGHQKVTVSAGDLFAISPNDIHDSGGLTQCYGWMLVFEPNGLGLSDVGSAIDLPEELLLLSFLRPHELDVGHFRLSPEGQRAWSERCRAIATELQRHQLGYVEAVQAHLRLMSGRDRGEIPWS